MLTIGLSLGTRFNIRLRPIILFYMPKACPYGGDIDNFTYYVFPNYIEVKTIQS